MEQTNIPTPKQKLDEAAKLIGDLAQTGSESTELKQLCSEKLHRKEELQRDTESRHAEELFDDSNA